MERLTDEMLAQITNETVFKALLKARSVLLHHKKISVSVSGGSDSDIVIDILERCKNEENQLLYAWYDTGIEYQATKDHLVYLENRYNIKIERIRAEKTIPTCCKMYGQPFLSKYVSNKIQNLQRHGFKWEDKPYDELIKEYPKSIGSVAWWTNHYTEKNGYEKMISRFDIGRNKYLKDFLIENPPPFKVSPKCCTYAKKNVAKKWTEKNDCDLNVFGVRKREGGIRAQAYKTCYSHDEYTTPTFRPVFWFSDEDKKYYEDFFGIVHSDCYTKYNLDRTGCVGCPFSKHLEKELSSVEPFEPALIKGCRAIFKDSYEYTRKYREYCKARKEEEKDR